MKKLTLLLALLSFAIAAISQDTVNTWKTETITGLSFSQASLSNWAAGGENAISGNVYLNFAAQYLKKKTDLETRLALAYGLNKQSSLKLRKVEDKIDLSVKYGYVLNPKLNLTTLFGFKSQFADGFDYKTNDSVAISSFLAPGYFMLGQGIDYKPLPFLSFYFSPITAKVTVVTLSELADGGAYGVEKAQYDENGNMINPGQKTKFDLGANIKLALNKDIWKNVNLGLTLQLFSDYLNNPQNIDIDSELVLRMKINDYLTTLLNLNLLYDHDIQITDANGRTGPRTQFKEVLGVGITYKL
jgi:hypothetical protein